MGEYKIVELNNEEFDKYYNQWQKIIFNDISMVTNLQKIMSEDEKLIAKKLRKNMSQMISLNLGIFNGEQFCGWFFGDQYNHETFYMRNSAILPEFRRKGLYTLLLKEVLARVQSLGFQVVLSRHIVTNNSIIIPKLKAGFVITSMELSDRFGSLVHLSYFFSDKRKKILDFRAGGLRPDHEIKEILDI